MTGEYKAGNYRLVTAARTWFFKVYRSSTAGWVIVDVPDGDLSRIDKASKRPLTADKWAQLVFWQ